MNKLTIGRDGTIDIAVGRSRKETSWKNREITWSELVKKLSVTHRTAELHSEYIASKKPRQDEIKDIGGFVGGYLNGGRRKAGSIIHRQLITLDADFVKSDLWDDFMMLYGNAAAVYSTHKHEPESPRLRLIVPLDRTVGMDEYMAISRRISSVLGIEQFDHTTFQPERLMYWPSTSKDGEYVFHYNDGEWLKADDILASYHNWKDSSEWPVSSREGTIIAKAIHKQGDPLEKTGMIGVFCRTYSIHEAIETFLSDVYESCDIPERYTYKEGSTAAGLVVYDDKYAYSHHGTDPISGKLCNAFDLVRLHKFGLRDEDWNGTKITSCPSYIAMQDLAAKDQKVVSRRSTELINTAKHDFEPSDDEDIEIDDEKWKSKLALDRKGNFVSTIDNIFLILRDDPKLKNRLFLNEFEGRLFVRKNLPWRKVTPHTTDFTDDDEDCLAHYLEGYKMPFTYVQKALAKIRTEFKFHPVRDYLNNLQWDGVERLDDLFIDYLGVEESDYSRAVARKTIVAAVARVFEPGVKFDTVLTLVGKEGIGKSTLFAKLAGQWFSDCLGDIHAKEGMESLRGVWVMEIAELASFRKADQEAIKRFLTSREDIYRPAYGRQLMRFPRQCIFVATTNKQDFLAGNQGNRRFLPLDTHIQLPAKDIFSDLTKKEIDQVWAEAVTLYKQGESLNLSEQITQVAELVRETHSELDDRIGLIEKYLNTLLPENWDELSVYDRRAFINNEEELVKGSIERTQVCVAEIWCEALGGLQRDMTTQNTKFLHEIMKKMKNWVPSKKLKRFGIYGHQRGYQRLKNPVNTRFSTVLTKQEKN
jgi:putative DNA primase/helicase